MASILESAPDFLCRIAVDGTILFLNRLAPGFRMESVVGTSAYEYTAPEYHQAMRECIDGVVRTGRPGSYASVARGPNGEPTHYYTRVAPILDDERVVALTLIATDISPIRKAESDVREADTRLRLILEATGIGLWNWDLVGDQMLWDEQTCRIFGIDREAVPKTFEEYLTRCVDGRDAAKVRELAERLVRTGVVEDIEYRIVRADGSVRMIQTRGTTLRDPAGRVVKMTGTLFDVTARHKLEEQLRQAQKMEAIGQLATGVAHNFNNMLAVIMTSLSAVLRQSKQDDRQLLTDAQEAATRAAKLVRQLMTIARAESQPERSPTDIGDVARKTVEMCRRMFDRRIEIRCEIDETVPEVALDGVAVEQALLNLLINARDAVESVENRSPRIDVSIGLHGHTPEAHLDAPTPHVCLRVQDNGEGMAEETRKRVFEPFFTTKKDNRGTGLGLTTVYAMARDHGGSVQCDSFPGRGTSFTILLPLPGPDAAGS